MRQSGICTGFVIIVTVHDAGISEEEVYIVMEFLTGDTLCKVIDHSTLPLADFIKVATQTLEGLSAAHTRSMLHRDIKPANIMVVWDSSGEYRLKLLDFGLAKFSNVPVQQTIDHDSSIMGSIHFMAPEQFERAPVDCRSDLYSLGCVLYYSLTGEYPFQGDNAPQVMASHLQARKWPVSQYRNDIPENILWWLDTMMSRNPEQRFADAKTALVEFQRIAIDSASTETYPAGYALESTIANRVVTAGKQLRTNGLHIRIIHFNDIQLVD